VRVHCLGADKLPSAGGSALRVELHHAGLHRHPSRPRARPAPVPAPRTPILEAQPVSISLRLPKNGWSGRLATFHTQRNKFCTR
jgi:hypothetical protein